MVVDVVLAAFLALTLAVPAAHAVTLLAVDAANTLHTFDSGTPGTFTASVPITGLQPAENVIGIDVRPADGRLYALGSTSRLYVVNETTGAATAVGTPGGFTLAGTEFGFDFNPVPDRIRVVSDADQNLRLDPDTGVLVSTDGPLAYSLGAQNPNIIGEAYLNNFAATNTTTLYAIDSVLNVLVIQSPPNDGILNVVGALGLDPQNVGGGFDIGFPGDPAFAALSVNGTDSNLYTINLGTGGATLVGAIGTPPIFARGLAVRSQGCESSLSGDVATMNCGVADDDITLDVALGVFQHTRFAEGDPSFTSGTDFDTSTAGNQTLAPSPTAQIVLNAGPGDDEVTVGSPITPASTLSGSVTVDGQAGADSLTFDDAGDAMVRTIDVTPSQVAIQGAGPAVGYAGIETLLVACGVAADTVNVLASPSTAMILDGNAPAVAPGDILEYDAESRPAAQVGDTIESAGVQPVAVAEFEAVNLRNIGTTTTTVTSDATTTTTVPAGCTGTGFAALVCRVDLLAATVSANVPAGTLLTKLENRVDVAREKLGEARSRCAEPNPKRAKKGVGGTIKALGKARKVLNSRAGRQLELQATLLATVDALRTDLRTLRGAAQCPADATF